jgi:hypothetical protein
MRAAWVLTVQAARTSRIIPVVSFTKPAIIIAMRSSAASTKLHDPSASDDGY